jgi:hypothetical protein
VVGPLHAGVARYIAVHPGGVSSTPETSVKRCSGGSGFLTHHRDGHMDASVRCPDKTGAGAIGGPERRCLTSAYAYERTSTGWTVSNAAEHAVRTRNDALDGLSLPCKQVVPGSSPGVGSESSQVSPALRPLAMPLGAPGL